MACSASHQERRVQAVPLVSMGMAENCWLLTTTKSAGWIKGPSDIIWPPGSGCQEGVERCGESYPNIPEPSPTLLQESKKNWECGSTFIPSISITHDGSMVLLYMVCHGSHQYTPVMLAQKKTSTMDPSWVKFPSYFHHISIIFPSYFHHISIIFPSYFHHIPIIYPSYFHHISIIYLSYTHHIPIIYPWKSRWIPWALTDLRWANLGIPPGRAGRRASALRVGWMSNDDMLAFLGGYLWDNGINVRPPR